MNKRVVVLGLLVAVMSVSAFGAGFLGTPTAELKKGQWSAGYNYMYSDMDLDKTKMKGEIFADEAITDFVEDELDVELDIPYSYKLESKDVKTQRHYATIGYGITDKWEAYFQLGGADVKAKMQSEGDDEWNDINFDNNFAWGWGTRLTFYEQENIRWGTSVQMNWLNTSWQQKETWEEDIAEIGTVSFSAKEEFDLDTYDLLIAVGPTVDMGGWKLYGGPFYYYLSGDLDYTGTITGSAAGESYTGGTKESGDIEANSNFGGFVGGQFALWENTDMTTEFSFTGDSWAIGTGIAWKF